MSRVLAAIARHGVDRPDTAALVCGSRSYAYAELGLAVRTLAARIEAATRDAEGPVALDLPNGDAWVIADLALTMLRRPCLPLPPFFTPHQRNRALTNAGVQWLITADGPGQRLTAGQTSIRIQRCLEAPRPLQPATAKITYTSGSTGDPKGACLSQGHMEKVASSIRDCFGPGFAGIHVPVLPLGVLLENIAGLYPVLLAGGTYCAAPAGELGLEDPFRPDFAQLSRRLTELGATSLILVPELLRGLTATLAFGGGRIASLKLVAVGGARIAPSLLQIARSVGLPAYEGYGLTECASVVAVNTPDADCPGRVGRPLAHVHIEIAPDGEILVGPDGFLGYVGEPPRSGPVATGDVGHLDADGFLNVTGRKSNRLITSYGRNVSPEWVESELLAQPEILQAVVTGDGEAELSAILVPTSATPDRARLARAVERANSGLPPYARIGAFIVGAPFTFETGLLTGNGRPRRVDVVAAYQSQLSQGVPAE